MKNTRNLFVGLFAVSALIAGTSSAFAQTCTSPTNIASAPTSGTDNTCSTPTGTGSNSIGTYCGAVASPENEIIYSINLGTTATGSFNVTNVQSTFNPAIVLLQAPCATANNCVGLPADANGNGGNETLSFAGNPGGAFFIAVTGSPGSGTCGSYSWNVTATLPVKLQKFSVN